MQLIIFHVVDVSGPLLTGDSLWFRSHMRQLLVFAFLVII